MFIVVLWYIILLEINMTLNDYAKLHNIKYRAAWNRFKAGKIINSYQTESGEIIIPEQDELSRFVDNKNMIETITEECTKRVLEAMNNKKGTK